MLKFWWGMIDFICFCNYTYSKFMCPAKTGRWSKREVSRWHIYLSHKPQNAGGFHPDASRFYVEKAVCLVLYELGTPGNSGWWTKACRCKNQKQKVYQEEIGVCGTTTTTIEPLDQIERSPKRAYYPLPLCSGRLFVVPFARHSYLEPNWAAAELGVIEVT